MKTITQLIFSFCLLFFLTSVIRLSPYPYESLKGWNTDHISHWMSSIAFAEQGIKIFNRPIVEICKPNQNDEIKNWIRKYKIPSHDQNLPCQIESNPDKKPILFINWSQLPRTYPIGVLIYSIPEALLYLSGISFDHVNLITTLQYTFAGAILCLLLWNLLITQNKYYRWRLFFIFTLPILLLEIMVWSAIGFYDSVSLFFLILGLYFSFQKEKPAQGILCWSLAFFLHYRALWFSPLLVWSVISWYRMNRHNLKKAIQRDKYTLGFACCFFVLSVISFLLSWPYIKTMNILNLLFWNRIHLYNISHIGFILSFALLVVLAIYKKYWRTLSLVLSVTLFLILTPEVRRWHELFLIPLFCIPFFENKKSGGIVLSTGILLFLFTLDLICYKSLSYVWAVLNYLV